VIFNAGASDMPADPTNPKNQQVSISELERAINFWRQQYPSSRDTMTLCPEAAARAELYARMILLQMTHIALAEFSTKAKKSFLEAEKAFKSAQIKAA
jgi:hypothetical protein